MQKSRNYRIIIQNPIVYKVQNKTFHCAVPENIHTLPTEGIGISWGWDSVRPKNLKKCMKLNWNFQRGGGVLERNPFRGGGLDIFWNYTL